MMNNNPYNQGCKKGGIPDINFKDNVSYPRPEAPLPLGAT
jgi:hypothetical protein